MRASPASFLDDHGKFSISVGRDNGENDSREAKAGLGALIWMVVTLNCVCTEPSDEIRGHQKRQSLSLRSVLWLLTNVVSRVVINSSPKTYPCKTFVSIPLSFTVGWAPWYPGAMLTWLKINLGKECPVRTKKPQPTVPRNILPQRKSSQEQCRKSAALGRPEFPRWKTH